jgi:hypothetical protein
VVKTFFYLLDVSVSYANILYNEAISSQEYNMVTFKEKLVMSLVGDRIVTIPSPISTHVLTKNEGRYLCAYCGLFSVRTRTRYKCNECNIALCMVGNHGKAKNCFALCHASESVTKMCIAKYEAMPKKSKQKK